MLGDYEERLKETLSRCKADQGALCAAYQESARRVRDLTQRQLTADERHRQLVDSLQEKGDYFFSFRSRIFKLQSHILFADLQAFIS